MTPDELYAEGYSLQYAAYGVRVTLETEDYRFIDSFVKSFGAPLPQAEMIRRGWQAAEVHFVARRLAGKGRNDVDEDD